MSTLQYKILFLIKNNKEARVEISKAAITIIDKIYGYFATSDSTNTDEFSTIITKWVGDNKDVCEKIVGKYYYGDENISNVNTVKEETVEEELPETIKVNVETSRPIISAKTTDNSAEDSYTITVEQHVWLTAWAAAMQAGNISPAVQANECLDSFIKKFGKR